MSSTTMHFGPEWMRNKHQAPTRTQAPPSPPLSAIPSSGASTYSALVSPAPPPQPEKRDEAHPFRYSKEELLRIYREGGGKGGLGLEVERWEGVVREVGSDPIGLRGLSDSEKKLFQGPLNSDLRRRQSTDYMSPLSSQILLGTDRPRSNLNTSTSATGSPLRERFGTLRRRDSTDQPIVTIPRKQSLSSLQLPQAPSRDPALPSPRRGSGYSQGFDGILNSGESWVARRRASEVSLKPSIGASRDTSGDYQQEGKASEILEEEEEDASGRANKFPPASGSKVLSLPDGEDRRVKTANPSLSINGSNTSESRDRPVASGLPTGVDYASIEWSYKDPSGQVQGPFRAELMQKWFDDGYFAGDLPMKRTHLDSQWITVNELITQHGGNEIFLTPPLSSFLPDLTHRAESPQEQQLFNGPFQTAPLQHLRSSTLDSYGSNPDSPSSSLGGGRFDNGSPDPNAFGGRGAYFGDNPGRGQSLSGVPDPSATFNRRNAFHDPSLDPSLGIRSPGFSNIPSRGSTSDGFSYNQTYSPGQGGWSIPEGTSFDGALHSNDQAGFSSNFSYRPGPASNFGNLNGPQDNIYSKSTPFQSLGFNKYINGASKGQHYSPVTQYADPQNSQHTIPTAPYDQHVPISRSNSQVTEILNSSPITSHAPWNNDGSMTKHPSPFDTPHPASSNAVVVQSAASSPWGLISESSRESPHANDSWPTPSQGASEESLKDVSEPDSLTFSNVGQHNEQQRRLAAISEAMTPSDKGLPGQSDFIHALEPPAPPDVPRVSPPARSKNKTSKAATQPLAPKSNPSTPQASLEPAPPTTTPKVAWLRDDDSKPKPSGGSISLREIQEAEVKKVETRKTAERERAARVVAPTTENQDAPQLFTASWGLPISQAGNIPRATVPMKDMNTSPAIPAVPVWTTAVKAGTAKKSMKEIQEEEEKRKKNAVKETAAAAVRRAYIETTQKVASSTQGGGGVWTTVGPSGKSTPNPPSTRPTVTSSGSSSSLPAPSIRTNGVTAVRPVSVSPTITTPARSDDPISPSHDFLKWLSSSLKGLNSSVNVEEIMSMLLSFPMDPDPSTVELISELIYANSTILDGRRFASEFISKRKVDAASRPKGVSPAGKSTTHPISIADVVKAVPKPTQPEWGFKVVNKKKKGSRT